MMTLDERRQLDSNTVMTQEIHATVAELRTAIIGNKDLGHVGLVGQVKRAHERMDSHEEEDRKQFQEVRETAKAIGDKLTKIIYGFAGFMVALKIGGLILDAIHK